MGRPRKIKPVETPVENIPDDSVGTPKEITDLYSLTKDELIAILRQKIVAETNTQTYVLEAKRKVEEAQKDKEALFEEYMDFRNKASKVIEAQTKHTQNQFQIIFNTIHNLEALMKGPDYSFLDKPEKPEKE